VLVCDFVDGKGLINTMVSAPRTKSLIAALKDSIQKGLMVLADPSKEHLSAMRVAGIRPSMGSTVPEGLKEWENLVRKNWPGLRKGLSLEAVENTIGPVQKSGALERIYLKFRTWFFTKESGTTCRISLDEKSLTHYDKDMGVGLELFSNSEGRRDKIFPPYDEHAYVWDKNPPNTFSVLGKESVYYMTHLYVLKFNSEGLQSWVLR